MAYTSQICLPSLYIYGILIAFLPYIVIWYDIRQSDVKVRLDTFIDERLELLLVFDAILQVLQP
jgi:hypothetical protein